MLCQFIESWIDFDEPFDRSECADIIVVTSKSQGTRVSRRGGSPVDRGHCVNGSDVTAGLCALC